MTEVREPRPDFSQPDGVGLRESTSNGRASADVRSPSVGEAIRWHWLIFTIPILLLAGAGAAIGLVRTPDYQAQTKLAISPSAGGASGSNFALNSEALAAGYSEAIDAPPVVQSVSGTSRLSPSEVRSQLSASSTADSPVLLIQATDQSASGAVTLANQAGNAMVGYLNQVGKGGTGDQQLLTAYRQAEQNVNLTAARVRALESGGSPQALQKAKIDLSAAQLAANGAGDAYRSSQSAAAASQLQFLSPAGHATSDRISKLELLILAGLFAGAGVGAVLANFRAKR